MIDLGDKAKDSITGFTGIVTAITEFLHGCRRITIQPQELKDGKPIECQTFDEPQVALIKSKAQPSRLTATGGITPRPVPKSVPSRH